MKKDGSDQGEKVKNLDQKPLGIKDLLNSDYVKTRFLEVMGEKAPAFLASVLNAIQKNTELAQCDQGSVLSSAMVAATLDLPIDSNLGFAAIIPYNTKVYNKETKEEYWVKLAQFQIMYKGFIQLALRSGQYKTINVSPIFEDEFESYDIITGDINIHPVEGGYREQDKLEKIVGYVAFFRLINGFERTEFWSLSKLEAHGKRFSKTFKNSNGLWKKDPHAMYAKTVLKHTLSKWGILSVTMQNAVTADQAVIKDFSKPLIEENISYVDANLAQTEDQGGETESGETETETQNENPSVEKTGEASAGTGNSQTTTPTPATPLVEEKPKEETGKTETAAETANADNTQGGLFQEDEAAALEEQYQQHKAGAYPDFR
jgi:recombination protein RecT